MIAEILRQDLAQTGGHSGEAGLSVSALMFPHVGVIGEFDMEKVARAGLEAIWLFKAGYDPDPVLGLTDYARGANGVFEDFRAILKERP